jgi:hypothetical protein
MLLGLRMNLKTVIIINAQKNGNKKKKTFTYTITIVTGPIYESEIMERRTFHIPQLLEVLQV